MTILTIRTDKPEAEIGLYADKEQLAYKVWAAHRELAETLHSQIDKLLRSLGKDWEDIEGIVCYKGSGSFTGLRIGLSVGNALAYSLGIPIAARGNDWIEQGISDLAEGKSDKVALPEYGSPVYTTQPKK